MHAGATRRTTCSIQTDPTRSGQMRVALRSNVPAALVSRV